MADAKEQPKRTSKRLSVQLLAEAARTVADKLAEVGKVSDPEEQPGFSERNPTWEDDLPPFRPSLHDEEILSISQEIPSTLTSFLSFSLSASASQLHQDNLPRERWNKAYKSIKKDLILRKQSMQSAVGTGARVEGFSLGMWDPYSPKRLALFRAVYNQTTEYLVLVMICCHLLILIFKASDKTEWVHLKAFNLELADGVITMLYTLECVLRILCLGFLWGPHSYLRNSYNRLDFVIVIDSWVHFGVQSVTGKTYFARVAVLRAFRGLLVFWDFSLFSNVLAIMDAIKKERPAIGKCHFFHIFGRFLLFIVGSSVSGRLIE